MMTITQQLPKAQAARLDLTSVLSPELHKIITVNADAIGAPLEFIFYPLLTAKYSVVHNSCTKGRKWQPLSASGSH